MSKIVKVLIIIAGSVIVLGGVYGLLVYTKVLPKPADMKIFSGFKKTGIYGKIVLSSNEKLAKGTMVSASLPKSSKVVASAIVDENGKYELALPKGTYDISCSLSAAIDPTPLTAQGISTLQTTSVTVDNNKYFYFKNGSFTGSSAGMVNFSFIPPATPSASTALPAATTTQSNPATTTKTTPTSESTPTPPTPAPAPTNTTPTPAVTNGTLSGTIMSGSNVQPGAKVIIKLGSTVIKTTTTDSAGKYTCGNITIGKTYNVTASYNNNSNSQNVTISKFSTTFNLALPYTPAPTVNNNSLMGTIMNGGHPQAGASVTVKYGGSVFKQLTTDSGGEFDCGGLTMGRTYAITAVYGSATAGTNFTADASNMIDLDLQ